MLVQRLTSAKHNLSTSGTWKGVERWYLKSLATATQRDTITKMNVHEPCILLVVLVHRSVKSNLSAKLFLVKNSRPRKTREQSKHVRAK